MSDRVECYAGASSPEEPRVVWWEGERYQVNEIIDRRREPTGLRFLVVCLPGNALFDLYYHFETESWRILSKGIALTKEKPLNNSNLQGE
jgi:hypothetical protein